MIPWLPSQAKCTVGRLWVAAPQQHKHTKTRKNETNTKVSSKGKKLIPYCWRQAPPMTGYQ